MTYRAKVEYDVERLGVRLAVGDEARFLTWPQPGVRLYEEGGVQPGADSWLHLREDVARAIYEALADYYGHASNNVRLLRKDYEAERARVDRFIDKFIR